MLKFDSKDSKPLPGWSACLHHQKMCYLIIFHNAIFPHATQPMEWASTLLPISTFAIISSYTILLLTMHHMLWFANVEISIMKWAILKFLLTRQELPNKVFLLVMVPKITLLKIRIFCDVLNFPILWGSSKRFVEQSGHKRRVDSTLTVFCIGVNFF